MPIYLPIAEYPEARKMFAGQLALNLAALFTGAAIYINIAKHPARRQLDDSSLLVEWKLAYSRAYMMQASLAIVGGLFGIVAFSAPASGAGCSEPLSCSQIGPTRSSDDADQPPADRDATGRRHGRNAQHNWALGHSARHSD